MSEMLELEVAAVHQLLEEAQPRYQDEIVRHQVFTRVGHGVPQNSLFFS